MTRPHIAGCAVMPSNGDPLPDTIHTLARPGVSGVLIPVRWNALEPSPGVYDFDLLDQCAEACDSLGLQYVFRLEDKTFPWGDAPPERATPERIPAIQYDQGPKGFISLRWLPEVWEPLAEAHIAVSQRYEGRAGWVGTATQESAMSMSQALRDTLGYTPEAYVESRVAMAQRIARECTLSRLYDYWNYVEGGNALMREALDEISACGCAVGGPDILPGDEGLQTWLYPYLGELPDTACTFLCAQNNTVERIPPADAFAFARSLGLNTVFLNNAHWLGELQAYWDALPTVQLEPLPRVIERTPPEVVEYLKRERDRIDAEHERLKSEARTHLAELVYIDALIEQAGGQT